MRVVALFRVSTQKQENEGASLDAQQRRYRELAAAMGWETVAEFRGQESATKAGSERAVLQQVLACLRTERVDCLWVIEQSRLTRGDELEVALLVRELRERGVQVMVGTTITDLSDPSGSLIFGIQSVVDRSEAQRFRARVTSGKLEKARQGKWTCGPSPYGHINPPPGAPNRGTLQPHPDEAPIVQRIYRDSVAGIGLREIAARLNADGIPSPRGGEWGKSSVRNILVNPVYTGRTEAGAWQKSPRGWRRRASPAVAVDNAHEPLVAPAAWLAVQAQFRGHKSPRPALLSGLLYLNGRRAAVDSSRLAGGRGTYYHPRDGKGGWIQAATVNVAIWQGFIGLYDYPEVVAALLRRSAGLDREGDIEARRSELEARRARLATKRAHLVDLVSDGTLAREDFRRKVSETEAMIAQAERDLTDLERRAVMAQDGSLERNVAQMAAVLRHKLSPDQQRRALRSTIARVDVELSPAGKLFQPGPLWKIESASLGIRDGGQIQTCWNSELSMVTVPIIRAASALPPLEALRLAA